MEVSIAAVISAAGSSSRMGGVKKEYRTLPCPPGEEPVTVLEAVVNTFASCPRIGVIVTALPPGSAPPPGLRSPCNGKPLVFVPGGPTRRASVHNALLGLEPYKPSHVLIHDGARPWVSRALIERVIEAAVRYGAVIPALPLTETPKLLDVSAPSGGSGESAGDGPRFIARHLRRAETCTAQTPQGFSYPEILKAHGRAREREEHGGVEYTDDAGVWGDSGGRVAVIPGESANRKITYPGDLDPPPPADAALPAGKAEDDAGNKGQLMQRIGLGRDLHRLAAGRKFLLGGVEIPFEKGELGHSDGDVLAHAVTDALLGAAGLGDIGGLYPPSDPSWKDACSTGLLKNAWALVRSKGWDLVNLDCTVSCEKPRILPFREQIRRSLAEALGVDPGIVFVKGKTGEGIGPIGTGEAVEALAVCLLSGETRQ